MYAIVMDVSGLTIAYQKAVEFLGFSENLANVMMYVALGLFGIITLIYLIKLVTYPKAVANEWNHPVRINFFSAVSISMLMLAIITTKAYPALHAGFWYAGTGMHFFMTLYTLSFWINHNQEIRHSNPAWFIPIVGNVLVPVGGVGLASYTVLIYFLVLGSSFGLY